jgi:hypothetical protein
MTLTLIQRHLNRKVGLLQNNLLVSIHSMNVKTVGRLLQLLLGLGLLLLQFACVAQINRAP